MPLLDSGNNTAGKANIDTVYNLQVNTPGRNADGTTRGGGEVNAGAMVLLTQNDTGELTGVPYNKSPETSVDYRLRVGTDTILFNETFNGLTQNSTNWTYTFSTLTASMPGAGTLNFSTVQGTSSAHGAFLRTYQYFPLIGTAPLYVEFTCGLFTAPLVANEVVLFGLGLPTAATTIPTDGVWFKLTTAGLVAQIAYNNSTVESGVLKALDDITLNNVFKFSIVVSERDVELWMDDVLLGELDIPTSNGQPFMAGSLPVFMMKYNTGNVTNTNTFRYADLVVSVGDIATNKPWAHQMALQGNSSYVGQNGHTQGMTAVGFSQLVIATTAAGANTTANVTGLGGLGVMTAQATNVAAAGDMIATSYQNPVPTVNLTGRNLVITGCQVSAINTGAAVATTPTTLVWGIAFGHTAVSLATTESGSFTNATTHAPRRIPLGFMTVPVGAAIGQTYDRNLSISLQSPIVVRPGEFLATTVRFIVGTATASQSVTYTVAFNGYFE